MFTQVTVEVTIDNNKKKEITKKSSQEVKSGFNTIFSFFVWFTIYLTNICIIGIGFNKNNYVITLCGMYGIYETTL